MAFFLNGELLALPLIPLFSPANENPRCLGGKGGFYGDVVFNRYLAIDEEELNGNIKSAHFQTYAGYLALDFWESLELFSTLGATCFKIALPTMEIETKSAFSWSIGLKSVLWKCDRFVLGSVAHYFSAHSPLQCFNEIDLIYREWQIGIGATYQLYCNSASIAVDQSPEFSRHPKATSSGSLGIYPYAGLKIGRAKVDFDEGPFPLFPDLGSKRWLGGILGVNFLFYESVNLCFEGRFGDEAALHLNSFFYF